MPNAAAALDGEAFRVPSDSTGSPQQPVGGAAVSEVGELIRTCPFGLKVLFGGMGCAAPQLERLEPQPRGGALFDHPVSLGEHQNWDLKAEGISGLEIDHQLYLSALLDWEVSRLGALENFSDVDPCLLI